MRFRELLAFAGALIGAAAVACSDPTGPEGTHPEGIVERTDTLGARPYGAAVSRNDVVYITQLDNQRLSRIDLPALGETDSVDVGLVPTHVSFNDGGSRAYVANQFSQSVGVVNVGTNTQSSSIAVRGDVFQAIPDRTDTRLYVVTNRDSLYEIDRGSGATLRKLALAGTGQSMAWHPNGYLLYVSTFTGGTAVEVDTRTMTANRIFVTGSKAQGVVVTRDGRELWVADEDLEKVDVFDLVTGTPLMSIPVGGNPWDIAITPDQQQLYVGLVFQGEVVVIDRASRTVVRRIATGGAPRRIVFNQVGTIAVVPNEFGYVTYIR
jgi:YVTN family beta-propeller protein